jgi:L-ascorbate metabolism protein UlaG (beta-lactamase superfamily)
MIKELDIVVLTHDIKDHGLTEGDIGAVVHCYSDGNAYEVEFTTAEGKTIAVLTLTLNDIRLMKDKEILHVRELAHKAA